MHYTWALVSVLIRDGFGASFVVPEVVQTILHFGNTVAVLILAKNILLLFVTKIHEVTPTHFLTSPHSLYGGDYSYGSVRIACRLFVRDRTNSL